MPPPSNAPDRLPEADSESDFLAEEARRAKEAVARTCAEVKADLMAAGDVRLWTKDHPWIAVGLATAAGFMAARSATTGCGESSKDETNSGEKGSASDRHREDGENHGAKGKGNENPRRQGIVFGGLTWLWILLSDLITASAEKAIKQLIQNMTRDPFGTKESQPERRPVVDRQTDPCQSAAAATVDSP